MAVIVDADWTIDRDTGDIRYVGGDHDGTGGTPSYSEVIEFHRWLQDLADDAVASGDDELDITNLDPSTRSTDNIITLKNGYNIDDTAAEHLFDGTIVQGDAGVDQVIYDGIVNYGNADVQIQIIQDGAVLADDWWNFSGAGLNPDAGQGISHRFMLKVHDFVADGGDIDGRRVLGIARRFGYTYQEFPINGTNRGNNVLALADSADLNNETAEGTVSGWTGITNLTEGYIGLDVNADGGDEFYYSQWDRDAYSINQLYERAKWLTRDGSVSTLYGLSGELFRGITHQIPYTGLTGTFDEGNEISWTGTNAGTGQVLADNGTDTVWIQLLTGVAPANGDSLSQSSPDAASATAGTLTDRSALIAKPFIGQSTGSAIIGAYGIGIEVTDITNTDKLFDLTNTQYSPPTLVTNTLTGLVNGEDRVLVAPWDGVTNDAEGNPAIQKDQLSLSGTLTGADVASITVAEAIPVDTPSSGTIRLTDDDGYERRLPYSSWTGSVFTLDTGDPTMGTNNDFDGVTGSGTFQATSGNDVYISYLDLLASGTTAAFQVTYDADRDLVIVVRDGGGTPIKQFIAEWSITNSSKSQGVIRTTDA